MNETDITSHSSWFGTPSEWQFNFTGCGGNNPFQAACLWKGFWEAIKQLVNGTFPTPLNGRTPITEPLNIHLYMNGCSSYTAYRQEMHRVWEEAGGDPAAGDILVKFHIDRTINNIVSCKGAPGKGILSVNVDASALSASPSTVHLYRSISPGGGADPNWKKLLNYKTDFCELADYYIISRLNESGVPCLCESRPDKYKTVGSVGNETATYTGTPGSESKNGFGGWLGDAQYDWFSNPDTNTTFNASLNNRDAGWVHLMNGSYVTDWTKVPFGVESIVKTNTQQRDMFLVPFGNTGYTPHFRYNYLCQIADLIQDYKWRSGDTSKPWYDRICRRGFYTLAITPDWFMGHRYNEIDVGTGNYSGVGTGQNACNYLVWYANPTDSTSFTTWNQATFDANPNAYTGGLWTTATIAFYNDNIRGNWNPATAVDYTTLTEWLSNVFQVMCVNSRPPNTPGAGSTWDSNSWRNNLIDSTMRVGL